MSVDIAIAHTTSPYISVYPWSAGFGAKYADPATLPGLTSYAVAFSPIPPTALVQHIMVIGVG